MAYIIILISLFFLIVGLFGSSIISLDEPGEAAQNESATINSNSSYKYSIMQIDTLTAQIDYDMVKDNAIRDDRESRWVLDGRPPVYVASGPGGRPEDEISLHHRR